MNRTATAEAKGPKAKARKGVAPIAPADPIAARIRERALHVAEQLARDELEPPDWAERSEFPELYKEPEKAPAPEEKAAAPEEKAPKEDHGRDDFHPEARGKPLGGPQSLSGIGVRDYP